jgi:hypothetical protein
MGFYSRAAIVAGETMGPRWPSHKRGVSHLERVPLSARLCIVRERTQKILSVVGSSRRPWYIYREREIQTVSRYSESEVRGQVAAIDPIAILAWPGPPAKGQRNGLEPRWLVRV